MNENKQTVLTDEECISILKFGESSVAMARAVESAVLSKLRAAGEPVAWVAADTLNSPHPKCVSSLAYMSQIDQDRGREYVPLAIIDLYAAPQASAEESAIDKPIPDSVEHYGLIDERVGAPAAEDENGVSHG